MKLKIKLFLWQLWLTLVVWMTFFSAPAMGGKDFFLTITFGVIALLIVWFLLYNDFSPPSDYSDSYSGFFVHSPEIAAVIERLMGLSAFFGAVLAVLVSLVAYNIFGDEYVTRASFKVFALLFVCIMMGGGEIQVCLVMARLLLIGGIISPRGIFTPTW